MYDDNNLSFRLVHAEILFKLAECASVESLMEFGDLAAHTCLAVGAESLGELPEGALKPLGTLIYNDCAGVFGKEGEAGGPTLFRREETLEDKPVARESGGHESGDKGCGTRQTLHIGPYAATFATEHESGVGYAGSAGIGDKGDVLAPEHALGYLRGLLMLIEFVMAPHRGVDIEMLEEHTGCACVLSEDKIDLLKHLDRAEGHIVEIPHGSRDKI